MIFAGHSNELVFLLVGCALLIGLHGYWHAKYYWEGLPPILDAFVSMAGFMAFVGAFVWGGRIGMQFNSHPHAGRVLALAVTVILFRAVRTWIGKEQVKYRKVRVRDSSDAA